MTEKPYHYYANVVRIIDGDTIIVDIDCGFGAWLKNQRLRFFGVNAPELKGVTKEAGLAAKSYVDGKLKNRNNVIIRTEKDDAFGRYLAEVYYEEDGIWRSLNHDLIMAGHASIR